jgi:hypothetical protein
MSKTDTYTFAADQMLVQTSLRLVRRASSLLAWGAFKPRPLRRGFFCAALQTAAALHRLFAEDGHAPQQPPLARQVGPRVRRAAQHDDLASP